MPRTVKFPQARKVRAKRKTLSPNLTVRPRKPMQGPIPRRPGKPKVTKF